MKYICTVEFVRNYYKAGNVDIEVEALNTKQARTLALENKNAIEKAVGQANLRYWVEDDHEEVTKITIKEAI